MLITALAALAAEDAWAKVRELKSGAELRIYKLNSKDPLLAKFDHAGDESLVVITRNGQVSVLKQEIDRIERRREPRRPLVKETRTDRKVAAKGAETTSNTIPGATTTVKTGLDIPSKAAFETIYDRAAAGK